MVGFILWLVIGGVIGWLASIVMRRDASQSIALNIVVGIVGAVVGGWLFGPLFRNRGINSDGITVDSLFVSFLGAVILLVIVNLFTRRRVR